VGNGERSRAETQAHNIRSRQKKNCSGTTGKVGEVESGEEVGCSGTHLCRTEEKMGQSQEVKREK
jgi:hypothetical protein